LCFGTEGVGKSTFGSQAPRPIFVPTEDGLGEIECDKFPLAKSLDDVLEALTELHAAEHDYETVVVDSADWLERLVWDAVCGEYAVKSIEKADGGYARGYAHALVHWRRILELLDALRNDRSMIVLLIAHAKVERFEDPESSAYDRYSPRLHKLASAMICEWSDAVLFATRKIRTQTEDAGFNRKKDDRQRHRQRWRRPNSALCWRSIVCRQESLWYRRRTAALLGGVHGGTQFRFLPRRGKWLIC
jgi:hypothetical protein